MRPPRKIAIWDPSETRRSVTRFVVHIWHYQIVEPSELPDIILVFDQVGKEDQMTISAAAQRAHCPVLLVGKDEQFACDSRLDPGVSMEDLLARIRILAARKRGPRPGTPKKPVASQDRNFQASRKIA